MSVFFLLKFWISFLGVGYIKHDPDLSQFVQIMICLSPQPVAIVYTLSRYISSLLVDVVFLTLVFRRLA